MYKEKIAVIMKDCVSVDSLLSADKICIYVKQDAGWECCEEHYVNINTASGLAHVRSEIQQIIIMLNDCRVIAGSEITGIIYNEFDRSGFSIFEISEISAEILDGIIADIKAAEAAAAQSRALVMRQPAQTSVPGVYYLDLIKLQMDFPELSSKKALKEFLDSAPFYELQLLCAHTPPWLSTENYEIKESKTEADKTLAVIRKKCGGESK